MRNYVAPFLTCMLETATKFCNADGLAPYFSMYILILVGHLVIATCADAQMYHITSRDKPSVPSYGVYSSVAASYTNLD